MGNKMFVSREDISMLADKLREGAGIENKLLFPDDFITTFQNICQTRAAVETPTYNELIMNFITGDFTTLYLNKDCEKIPDGFFQHTSTLVSVYAPYCLEIGEYAFNECTNLSSVYTPKCEKIMTGFQGCSCLSLLSFPRARTININALYIRPSASISRAIWLKGSEFVSFVGSVMFPYNAKAKIFVPHDLCIKYRTTYPDFDFQGV